MKVLMVNNMGTLHGGAETMIARLRNSLENKGHNVRILAGNERGDGERIADATFLSFDGDSTFLRIMYLFNPFAILAVRYELETFKPDIVHLHLVSKASPFILPLFKDYPTVLTMHDHTYFDPTRIKDIPEMDSCGKTLSDYFIHKPSLRLYMEKIRFFFLRRFARYVDLVFTCSDFYGVCAAKSGIFREIKTLHNGIRLPDPVPVEDKKEILFVGRLSEEKGVLVLIEAIARLRSKHPDLRLKIAGSGHLQGKIEDLIREKDIVDMVEILGFKPYEEVIGLYRSSSLVAVPSIYPDNLPTVCIEAMGVGRAVIASKIGGIPELIDEDKTGILVEPSDAEALAEGIDRLFSDFSLLRKMGEEGRKKAERCFSESEYYKKTLATYEDLNKRYKKI